MSFNASDFLKHVTEAPGIYQMLDQSGTIIYVGKAKNLKKRLASYFRDQVDSAKTAALVKKIADIRLIATPTENDALLLETHLIKQYRPRYNILFRDDKSFPYLHLTTHAYPRLNLYRSHQKPQGDFFGPYVSGQAVREALDLLQKLFQLRSCSDSFFSHRSRPCLQYHIKRCSAPCVGYISPETYAADIANAKAFLQGDNPTLIQAFVERMNAAAIATEYESAAFYRDQIQLLHQLDKDQQNVDGHCDVFAIESHGSHFTIQVLAIRQGKVSGNHCYFPVNPQLQSDSDVLESFIGQFYLHQSGREIPPRLIVNIPLTEAQWLSDALSLSSSHKIKILHRVQEPYLSWLKLAEENARLALKSHLASSHMQAQRYHALAEILAIDPSKKTWRLECFDISHSLGEATQASCVVFDEKGPCKSAYRIFSVEGVTPGDDYAAMAQALRRRYTRIKNQEIMTPDILLIDGGRGQLNRAKAVLAELDVAPHFIIGIAKGEGRKPGLETLWLNDDQTALQLPAHSPALHVLQHLRDEAHRFAISKHRAKRQKNRQGSSLEKIPGLGPQKRQALLNFFGGLTEVKKASSKELQKVPGIGPAMATLILETLQKS